MSNVTIYSNARVIADAKWQVPYGFMRQSDVDTLSYGVQSFAFLLDRGSYTYSTFADKIISHSSDPRAAEVARIMRLAEERMSIKQSIAALGINTNQPDLLDVWGDLFVLHESTENADDCKYIFSLLSKLSPIASSI